MKSVAVFGSTGSVGTQTLEVVREKNNDFEVVVLCGNKNYKLLYNQIKEFNPKYAVICEKNGYDFLISKQSEYNNTKILFGYEEVSQIATLKIDVSILAITGSIAIMPLLNMFGNSKVIGIANKETIVACGDLIKENADKTNTKIIPVDSEHSAIYQCLNDGVATKNVKNIVITASGGALRDLDITKFKDVEISDVLKHPNWDMGAKITVDSATMSNKALEVLEAAHLFGLPIDMIDAIIHKESILHGMVNFEDGSTISHMGVHSMKIPISYALSNGERVELNGMDLNLIKIGVLTFSEICKEKYPMYFYARDYFKQGLGSGAVFNVVNEFMVDKFLNGEIGFLDISKNVMKVCDKYVGDTVKSLDDFKELEQKTIDLSEEILCH